MSIELIAILEVPGSCSLGFVVLEFSFKVSSVRVKPLSFKELSLKPLSNIFDSCGIENVCTLTLFLSLYPLSRVHVLVGVDEHALTMLLALRPFSVVLRLVGVIKSSDAMLEIVLELSIIDIPVEIGVFALSLSDPINIGALVSLPVGVYGGAHTCEVLRRVGGLSTFRGELIRSLFSCFLWHRSYINLYQSKTNRYSYHKIKEVVYWINKYQK